MISGEIHSFQGWLKPNPLVISLRELQKEREGGLRRIFKELENFDEEVALVEHKEDPWLWELDRDVPDDGRGIRRRIQQIAEARENFRWIGFNRNRPGGRQRLQRDRRYRLLLQKLTDIVNDLHHTYTIQDARIQGTMEQLEKVQGQIAQEELWAADNNRIALEAERRFSQAASHAEEESDGETTRNEWISRLRMTPQWISTEPRPVHPEELQNAPWLGKLQFSIPSLEEVERHREATGGTLQIAAQTDRAALPERPVTPRIPAFKSGEIKEELRKQTVRKETTKAKMIIKLPPVKSASTKLTDAVVLNICKEKLPIIKKESPVLLKPKLLPKQKKKIIGNIFAQVSEKKLQHFEMKSAPFSTND